MAVSTSFVHCTSKELDTIPYAKVLFADSTGSDFNSCRGTVKNGSRRCGNPIKKKEANLLWEGFRDESKGYEMESFLNKLEEFISATHCHHHIRGPLGTFRQWKQSQIPVPSSPATPSVTTEPEQKSSVESVYEVENTSISSLDTNDTTHDGRDLAHVEATDAADDGIRNGLSNLAISDGSHLSKADVKQFVQLGITSLHTSLHRTGSLRDDSDVLSELYTPLTESQQEKKIVYIFQHISIDNLFKIGSTTGSADAARRKSGNCYGTHSKVIYVSQARFSGASKAAKLAQVFLRHENVHVKECNECEGEHWFYVPEEKVRRTVRLMEELVRLPGYTMQEGSMKLSPAADSLIQGVRGFSLEKLEETMGLVVEEGEEESHTSSTSLDTVTMAHTAVTVEDQQGHIGADRSTTESHPDSSQSTTHLPEEKPTNQGRFGVRKFIRMAARMVQGNMRRQSSNESRKSISERDQESADEGLSAGDPPTASEQGSVTSGEYEEHVTVLLWGFIIGRYEKRGR